MLEILPIHMLIGVLVLLVDYIVYCEFWKRESAGVKLTMYAVFLFLWPLAVWDYIRCALHKRKGGIRG